MILQHIRFQFSRCLLPDRKQQRDLGDAIRRKYPVVKGPHGLWFAESYFGVGDTELEVVLEQGVTVDADEFQRFAIEKMLEIRESSQCNGL